MLTEKQIKFLNRVCKGRWTESNGVILVEGDIDMNGMNLIEIPVQFGQVNGHFDCQFNKLTNLLGCPSIVTGYFNCNSNQLTSLEGGPKESSLYAWYTCENNNLYNLFGAPEICNYTFSCYNNKLTSLEGCPHVIKHDLYCGKNNLKYLWGIGRVEGKIHYNIHNKIDKWIITCARRDVIFPFGTLEENINWIKREQKYSSILGAPKEIRQLFSPRILQLVDSGVYNESKILDYKKFSRLC